MNIDINSLVPGQVVHVRATIRDTVHGAGLVLRTGGSIISLRREQIADEVVHVEPAPVMPFKVGDRVQMKGLKLCAGEIILIEDRHVAVRWANGERAFHICSDLERAE